MYNYFGIICGNNTALFERRSIMSYLGKDIKKLGFGLMRLPKKGEKIDIEQAKKMVDIFMAAGFTYFDTAFAYAGSEEAAKEMLVDRYPRESYQLATKNAAWINCKTREDAIAQFYTSLERTGAGYFDFYLLHNLGDNRTKAFDDFDMWTFVQEKKAEGLIKHIGFSFHSTAEYLDEILTKHPEMEFVQLQINYADWENASVQSKACYEVARKHNKPVVIMEPIKGGMLANPPESVEKVFKDADPNASCASWALRYAADLDGVITVLSGMSNIEQVEDNVAYIKGFMGFTEEEKATVEKARKKLAAIPLINCTSCDYCAEVCPSNIGISGTFGAKNLLTLYGKQAAEREFGFRVKGSNKSMPSDCIECAACEEVCPQHLEIVNLLKECAVDFN